MPKRIAIITGAASGIGRASAEIFSREGAAVVIADRNQQQGEKAASEIGGSTVFLPLDVTSEQNWQSVIDETVSRFGGLHILVNCAGVGGRGTATDIESTTLDDFRFIHAVNTEGVFLGCKYGIAAMKNSGGGSIVNISSIAGIVGHHSSAAYCSSKGAVRLLTKSIALHCGRQGYNIRCNSVHPSFIDTPMVASMVDRARDPQRFRDKLAQANPLGRLGEAKDVANVILFLASDESAFVTGAEYIVDGGTTAM